MSLHTARLASLIAMVPALLVAERAAQAGFALMQLEPTASSSAAPPPAPPAPPEPPSDSRTTRGDIVDPWQQPPRAPSPPPPIDPWPESAVASDPIPSTTLPALAARSELLDPWQGQPMLEGQEVRVASVDASMIDPWASVRPARSDFRLREIVDPWAQP